MNRQPLTDGTGAWFDRDRAKTWEEGSYHDGRNFISHATGSQWEHEQLYRIASGTWVLHSWSQWQGSGESWVAISDAEATRWLAQNGHEPHESLTEAYAELEI